MSDLGGERSAPTEPVEVVAAPGTAFAAAATAATAATPAEPGRAPTAIITGAARGIGAATALRLSAAGWRLVLFDRCADDPSLPYPLASKDDLDAIVDACGGPSVALGVVGDVRDSDALDRAVALAVDRFEGLDAAVAVAGCMAGGQDGWTTSDEIWDVALDINLHGVRRLARAAIPALLAQEPPRHGRFLAVSSAGGTLGLPLLTAYSAAKHAVVGFIRSLAAELGPHGVTANTVAPGSTQTAMLAATAPLYGLGSPSEFAVHHQLGRLLTADEVAAALAWLCSPDTDAITGSVLAVDGGMTAS
jgi:SDR family mycofactocin-dependent oxidoreductase